ncbi:Myotubularin-related protein 7, partial [Nibea albiflora]
VFCVCDPCQVENVRLLDRSSGQRKASTGTLYLSATHTIFVENNPETRKETWVLHSMVSSVERPPTIPAGSQLILRCKDFRVFQILIPQERDCLDVHSSLVRLSRPEKYSELYCLSFNPNVNKEEREESWSFIDLMADYKRMGVPNNLWVTTAANSEYRVCDTYPSELFVPKSATPAIIVGSSRFRSRGRFPALSYFHQDTLAAVCRCSQPLSGFSGRCQEDEMMLQAVMKSNPGSDYIYVVDTRPKAVADEGISVLVHCSDGWDRTAQACSVASILLDPFYRTTKGLMVLIERDWVSFGHKFSHRYAHLDGDPKEVSPVIDQFLECVWQLSEQFPLHERSHSVWPQLWKDRAEYANPLYKAELSQTQGVLRPNTTPYCFKMWKGLYNHVEKSTPPRQSPADFLSAVREETQQLEEELTNHQERIAALTGRPITWEKIEVPRRRTSRLRQRHCGPDPPTTYTDPITSPIQDNGYALASETANQKAQTKDPALTLPLGPHAHLKSHDPDDLSTCSDLESGVADLSSRSSSGGDDRKDPDSDEAAFITA